MPSKLDSALALVEKGYYVFPVEVNGKFPTIPWREGSTRDVETVKRWWRCPATGWEQDYNIGIDCGKSGILVVDVDCKNGKQGKENYEKLEKEHGFHPGCIVRTPTGGLHLYYAERGYRNTTEKIAGGIDTRAEGGFVLAPGSEIDGGYYTGTGKQADVTELLPCPRWLLERLHEAKALPQSQDAREITVDNPDDVEWCRNFLLNHPPAVQGNSGDNHTIKTAMTLKDHGVSKETALDLMLEHWNYECSPPWTPEDLKIKVWSAYRSAKNATGVKSAFAEFEPIVEPKKPSYLRRMQRFELKKIPKRQRVLGDLAIRKKVSALVAPGGAGKSIFTLTAAIAKATGRDDILGMKMHGRGRVAICNNEDDLEEMHRRLGAIMQFWKVTMDDLHDENGVPYLFLNSGEDSPLKIAKRSSTGLIKPHDADDIADSLIENNIDILIVDPFAETHPAKENDNEEILHVGRIFRAVAQRADCGLILVHHTRKHDNASSDGHSGNLDSMRGASSLGGLARVVVTFNAMSEKQAREYAIKLDDRHKFVLLEQAKANMSAPTANKHWYERVTERINMEAGDPDSGEDVGVLRPVKLDRVKPMNDNARNLLTDMEQVVLEPMEVRDVAEAVTGCPMHMGKNPNTIEKAIRRLFSEGVVTGFTGVFYMDDPKKGNQRIRFEPNRETPKSLDALL